MAEQITTENKDQAELTIGRPSFKKLQTLTAKAGEIIKEAKAAATSQDEARKFYEKHKVSVDELYKLELKHEELLRKPETYNPLKSLEPTDYKRLVLEKIITEAEAKGLEDLDNRIKEMPALKDQSAVELELSDLLNEHNEWRKWIEKQIEIKKTEVENKQNAERMERAATSEKYRGRVEELKNFIRDLENKPEVFARIKDKFEGLEREYAKEMEKKTESTERDIKLLRARHDEAVARLSEILGEKNLKEDFAKRAAAGKIDLRKKLIKSIIEGEDKNQLKDPNEVVPWKVSTTSVRYGDAMAFLGELGRDLPPELAKEYKQLALERNSFVELFGLEQITDKAGKKIKGDFWAAFDTRKSNDALGVTLELKKAKEEQAKKNEALEKAMNDLVAQGGFIASKVPVSQKMRDGSVRFTYGKGAVLFEKIKFGGRSNLMIKEFIGATDGVVLGASFREDLADAPPWLREAYLKSKAEAK